MQCIADGKFHNGSLDYDFTHVTIEHDTTRAGVNYFDDVSVKILKKDYISETK